MWSTINNFVRRHKRKFVIVGGIAGGVYLFRRVLASKISQWETRQTQAFLDQMKRYHHFEGTLQTCDSTVLSVVPKVRETVQAIVKVDELIDQLKTNPHKKLEIWEELKVMVFTEIITEICGEVLLVIFLRVQLSIIGGYMYIDTQNRSKGLTEVVPSSVSSCSQEIQQKYLGCIQHFLSAGMQDLVALVKGAVEGALGKVELRNKLVLADFQMAIKSVKKSVIHNKKGIANNIATLLVSDDAMELGIITSSSGMENSKTIFQKMILETRDVLETDDFRRILDEGMDLGFENALDRITESMMHVNQTEFVNLHEVSVPMAKMIPALHSHYKMYYNCSINGQKCSLLQQLLQAEKAKTFSANIYEAFSQPLDIDQNIRPSISNSISN